MGVPLLLFACLFFFLILQATRLSEATRLLQHTDAVLASLHRLERLLLDSEVKLRGFLLLEQKPFLKPEISSPEIDSLLSELRKQVGDNANQLGHVERLAKNIEEWKARSLTRIEERLGKKSPLALNDDGKEAVGLARDRIQGMIQEENSLLSRRASILEKNQKLLFIAILFAGISLASALIFITRKSFRRIFRIYEGALNETVSSNLKLEKTNLELEEALRSRDEFLSIASHELKTPLTSLKMQAQLLKRAMIKNDPEIYSKDRMDSLVEQTDRSVSRLNRLIDDMLDVSRIRTGKLSLEKESFDLRELLRETVDRMESQFIQAGVNTPVIEASQDCSGEWDKMRLEQVFTNLLSNALRYGNKKPIRVGIQKKKEKILAFVEDQGVGIPEENRELIFKRFERASYQNEFGGLGLGLFIAKQIVAAHSGKIWVESEWGKGSSFFVELPQALPAGNA